ncbi:MAG: dihydrodipicolinate synthase family protein [Kiloniellaceae bacterium]
MAKKRLGGVIAAIATPIDGQGAPDVEQFTRLARYLLDNGCDGLNVLGTTGEATSFSLRQRSALMEAVAESGLPLDRLMGGTGAASVDEAAELTRLAGEIGFSGALMLPPFYYKDVTHGGLVRYFASVLAAARQPIPIYLYNFPALSGVRYDVELIRRLLAEFGDRFAGLKDSSGDMDYARSVAEIAPQFDVFPSNEATLAEARGGIFAGCISATANVNAAFCARSLHQTDDAALKTAVSIRQLFTGMNLVAGVKALLSHIHNEPQLARPLAPLVEIDKQDKERLFAAYDECASAAG